MENFNKVNMEMENLKLVEKNIKHLFEASKNIYTNLMDDTSKNIYKNLFLYWNFGEFKYIENLQEFVSPYLKQQWAESNLKTASDIDQERTIIIYGAHVGRVLFDKFNRTDNIFFCDRDYMRLQEVKGVRVISPQELFASYSDALIYIAASGSSKEIYDFLIANNIPKENIVDGYTAFDYNGQYFDEMVKPHKDEIFLDIGSFDADTTVRFSHWCSQEYKKIYLFEPDKTSLEVCKKAILKNQIQNVEYIPYAAWDKKETLKFHSNGFSSAITESGEIEIETDRIDDLIGDIPVTFIKMDIEGAELNALKGAEKLIRKYKPTLAISLYHKPEDIISLPLYIKQIVPEYQLYLRHYTTLIAETVLYAIMPDSDM